MGRAIAVPGVRYDRAKGLEERFNAAWARTDKLFGLIKKGELLTRPIVWRHPFMFYVGHLPAFTWNQICGTLLNWKSFNSYFDDLFCRGMDPDVDTGECHWHPDVPEKWPNLKETLTYRNKIRCAVLQSIDAVGQSDSKDIIARSGRVFEMVLEHEYMHQETLLYMLQEMPIEQKNRPVRAAPYSFRSALAASPIEIPQGVAHLGAGFNDLEFGWDNEFSEWVAEVPEFIVDSLPVTNAEFFEFVGSGAYEDECFWQPQDWDWKRRTNKSYPNSWVRRDHRWFYRAMFDVFPLPIVAHWPVYVSLAEARAYASWRGKRLLTEAEFHRAAFGGPDRSETQYPWGDGPPEVGHGNFDFIAWSPMAVGSNPAGCSRWGVHELIGNGWEWTDAPFAPFPGFEPMSSYPDYSKDFFDGKHFVLKGASWATAAELIRPTFRNWYQAHYPYVFAKFRCVSSR